ncbi:MAG TPA: hypothetical protein VNW15_06555 [Rhizomicrobium sp.]|jgi:hypothetical protein|nr:hypothetical protein [Rhizomicrobium sp.]
MEPTANEADSNWRVVGPSWSSVRAAFLSMKSLFLSAAFASLLLSAFAVFGPDWIGSQPRLTATLVQIAIAVLVLFLRMLILAPVAVAVHRFVLLGERTPGIISLRPSYTRRFALWLCAISLAFFAVAALGAALSLSFVLGARGKLFFFVSLIAAIVCSVFSVLVFPSIAIDESSSGWRGRLGASWRRMDGHFWLFVGLSLVAILPIVLVVTVFAGILGAVEIFVFRDSGKSLFGFGMQAGPDLANILTAMLGAAIASRFYARFRDQTITPAA